MIIVDEQLALRVAATGWARPPLEEPAALTYGRCYRLIRALANPGAGRLAVRGRFTRIVDTMSLSDQQALREWMLDPASETLRVIDPRPHVQATAALQNTYSISLLQAETLAVALSNDWPLIFGDPASVTTTVQRAVTELGLTLTILDS